MAGVKSDGAEVVAQPVTLASSTISISTHANFTGGGDSRSRINRTLTAIFHRSSLVAGRNLGGVPLSTNQRLSMRSPFEESASKGSG